MSVGRQYIFEPFNTGAEMWIPKPKGGIDSGTIDTPLRCMYNCECAAVSNEPGEIHSERGRQNSRTLKDYCAAAGAPAPGNGLVVKTVNLDDYAALLTLDAKELHDTVFVQLVRDPRAISNENRCLREYFQALSAKDFLIRSGLQRAHFKTLFFENWAMDVEGTVRDLHATLGWDETPEIVERAVSDHKDSVTKWTQAESHYEREKGLYCEEMMAFFGYTPGSADYSKLSDARLHDGALSGAETEHLADLRSRCGLHCAPGTELNFAQAEASLSSVLYKPAAEPISETDFAESSTEDD